MYNNNINQTMKRKSYQKPTMKVVKLQHQGHILTVSGEVPQATKMDYESEEW